MSKDNKREKLVAYICMRDRVQFNGQILRAEEVVYGKPSVLDPHDHFELKSKVDETKAQEESDKAELRSVGKSNDELIGEVTHLTNEIIRYTGIEKELKAEVADLKTKLKLAIANAAPAKKVTTPAAKPTPAAKKVTPNPTSGDAGGDGEVDDDLVDL